MLLYEELAHIVSKQTINKGISNSDCSPQRIKRDELTEKDFLVQVFQTVSDHDFCIIESSSLEISNASLNIFDTHFGSRLKQNKLGNDEIPVMPIASSKKFINNRDYQPMHTDNAYSNYTPTYVMMQCVKPADSGGETLLVSVDDILDYLGSHSNTRVNSLFESNCITYVKDSSSLSKAILFTNNDKIMINYTIFANMIFCKTLETEALFKEITRFVHNPKNQLRFKLNEGDTLILNNSRLLHGRTAFEGERLLKRIWY